MAQRYVLLSGLKTAAFPDAPHPGALVYVPPGLDLAHLAVVIYLHGFDNCVQNVVQATPGPCVHGGEPCPCADLIGHLDRSGRSAVLVLPEVRYYAKSADPGALGRPGALRALLGEIFTRLRAQLDGAGVDDVEHAVVVSHSGGHHAAASLAVDGDVPVQEVWLLDSLYAEQDRFLRFLAAGNRLVNLYTDGGTGEHSRAMSVQMAAAGIDLYNDDSDAPLQDGDLRYRVVWKRVDTPHSAIPITYFGQLLASSGLPLAAG